VLLGTHAFSPGDDLSAWESRIYRLA
jgi:hypothetical protein